MNLKHIPYLSTSPLQLEANVKQREAASHQLQAEIGLKEDAIAKAQRDRKQVEEVVRDLQEQLHAAEERYNQAIRARSKTEQQLDQVRLWLRFKT